MTFDNQWTTPPPPRGYGGGPDRPREPIRPREVWAGIGLAILGHVVTIAIPVVIAFAGVGGALWTQVGLLGQFVLFVTCIAVGIVLLTRDRRRGLGLGLLIGWGVGVIVLPVVGFGICVYALSRTGVG